MALTQVQGSGISNIIISADGEVTKAAQPAFMAGPSGAQTNMANDTTIVLGTEVFDVGANFASNTFTAPVTGKYQLNATIRLLSVDSASNYIYLAINTSNRDYFSVIDPDFGQDAVYWNLSVSVMADMDASDTAIMKFGYDGGAQQVDTNASGGTLFSGALIC
jgi:thiamine biosynthesis lipoprotein ApbE